MYLFIIAPDRSRLLLTSPHDDDADWAAAVGCISC